MDKPWKSMDANGDELLSMFFLAKDEQRFGHFLVHARFRNLMCCACIVCVSHCTLIGIPWALRTDYYSYGFIVCES